MRKLISLFILILSSLTTLHGQVNPNGGVYYVRQTAPWSQSQSETLDQAFGAGNYATTDYSIPASELFSDDVGLVYLEGSNFRNPAALNAYLTENRTLIENWVSAGGRLFINAAPNEGGNLNLGFGGVTLRYPAVSYLAAVARGQAGHPIFNGPRNPVGASWFGMFFAHGAITGNGLTALLTGDSGIILAELQQGTGVVFFGSMTTPNFQSPLAEATNLRINILQYLKTADLRQTYYADGDGDGFGNAAVSVKGFAAPAGYVLKPGDCADTQASVYPGAPEVCDGLDNDCDGQADEGVDTRYYADTDGDGFGNAATSLRACERPVGYVTRAGDCNDADASTYPGAPETCDGIDHNCDGVITRDVTAPVLIASGATLPDVAGQCAATVTKVPYALDNCAGRVRGTTNDPLSYTGQGTYTITWRFRDGNGNESTALQKVIVRDTTAPLKPILAAVTGTCSVTAPVPVTTDNCAGIITGTTADPLTYTAKGTHFITWQFADGHGNISTAIQVVVVEDREAPVITTNGDQHVANDKGVCSAAVFVRAGAADNCGVGLPTGLRSDGLALNEPYPVGTTTVTWQVRDINENAARPVIQTITVTDTEAPTVVSPGDRIICFTPFYTLPALVAKDNCGVAAIRYLVSGATNRAGAGADASGAFGAGTNIITWTVVDVHGQVSTAVTTLTVNPQPLVTIPEAFAFHKGVSANTVYPGYVQASRLSLQASAAGGSGAYAFLWSTGETTASITVTRGGNYSLTVTDILGCSATLTTTIEEVNVAAGGSRNGKEEVVICHNGQTVAIGQSAVSAHLAHGCTLGGCQSGGNARTTVVNPQIRDLGLTVYPNPAPAYTHIEFTLFQEDTYHLALYDLKGALLQEIARGSGSPDQFFSFEIPTTSYPSGVYLVRLTTNKRVYSKRLLISK